MVTKDLAGTHEAAEIAGVSKQTFCNWVKRGVNNVPEPIARLKMSPIWDAAVLRKWSLTLKDKK
jgi:hypothetical protein